MAHNDIYCGLCGAALSIPLFSATDAPDESRPGNGRPRIEDMAWLEDVRMLYQTNHERTNFESANLSSIVTRRDDDGWWDRTGYVPALDDFENTTPDAFRVFDPYMEGRYHIIPLHDACNKVLAKFLNYSVGTTPKDYLRVLFEALRSFHDTSSDFYAGKIKYGKISKQHGQFWYPTLTTKAFVYDPFFTSPVLKTYYDNLPEIGKDRDEREDSAVCYMKTTSKPDPFRKLPPELLMMILMHLPAQSIRQLKLASVAIVQLQLPGSFWKQKLKRDMPWLWDFPGQGTEQTQKDLDWLQIYKDIYIGSKGNGKSPFFNLANRNRIWRISEQIAPRFVKCQDEWKIAQEREREKLLALTSEKERRLWPHLDWL